MTTVLLILALAGALVTLAALVAAHVAPTGLSPLRDPVSAYGISRVRGLYRAQTLGTAVSAAALAVVFATGGVGSATPAIISLAVLAIARGIISWVPMDAEGAPRSSTGRAHDVLAYLAFAAAAVSGFMVGIAFSATDEVAGLSGIPSTFGWIMVAASVLTILASGARGLRPIFGLAERIIYVGMLALLFFTPIALLTR